MKNRMADLRDHLFETLEALKDEDQPMDLERAKQISEVGQTIINSAKVEVEFLKAVGATAGGEFFAPAARRLGVVALPEAAAGGRR
jgi:hypothetical protein